MVTLLSGLVGGLLGAAAMTAGARALDGDQPWPSATVWAMYLGDGDPASYETPGLAVHLGYGAVAGGVFATVGGGLSTYGASLFWAVVWAAALAAGAVGLWLRVVIGDQPGAESLARVAGLHLAYGVVLGMAAAALSGL